MIDHTRTVIIPEGGAKPLGPYSPGIRAGRLVFASGTTGMDPKTSSLVEGGVAAETRQALANLSKVLEAGGSSIGNVMKTVVFITLPSELPPASSTLPKLASACRVSAATPPSTNELVLGSIPIVPEANTNLPARMPGE